MAQAVYEVGSWAWGPWAGPALSLDSEAPEVRGEMSRS